jgi:phenylalanyl-tRNA synthetase beta chain
VPELRLANPISADLDTMRPSILPNLIVAAGRSADRGAGDAALFEIGPQYADDTPEGQALMATGIRSGMAAPRRWSAPSRPVDALDAKGDALAGLAACGAPVDSLQITTDAPDWYHPGRSGVLRLGPKLALAYFGELHPGVLRRLDVDGPIVGFELFLDRVPEPKTKPGRARPLLRLPPFQPVERDFAFILDDSVTAEAVLRAARSADKTLITDVTVFDLYAGKGIEAGKKSLAIGVTLQPTETTLTDAEIDAVAEKVVAAVAKATGGVLRG